VRKQESSTSIRPCTAIGIREARQVETAEAMAKIPVKFTVHNPLFKCVIEPMMKSLGNVHGFLLHVSCWYLACSCQYQEVGLMNRHLALTFD
jgi:hypothetical protein